MNRRKLKEQLARLKTRFRVSTIKTAHCQLKDCQLIVCRSMLVSKSGLTHKQAYTQGAFGTIENRF